MDSFRMIDLFGCDGEDSSMVKQSNSDVNDVSLILGLNDNNINSSRNGESTVEAVDTVATANADSHGGICVPLLPSIEMGFDPSSIILPKQQTMQPEMPPLFPLSSSSSLPQQQQQLAEMSDVAIASSTSVSLMNQHDEQYELTNVVPGDVEELDEEAIEEDILAWQRRGEHFTDLLPLRQRPHICRFNALKEAREALVHKERIGEPLVEMSDVESLNTYNYSVSATKQTTSTSSLTLTLSGKKRRLSMLSIPNDNDVCDNGSQQTETGGYEGKIGFSLSSHLQNGEMIPGAVMPDDNTFRLVGQCAWENDICWDSEVARHRCDREVNAGGEAHWCAFPLRPEFKGRMKRKRTGSILKLSSSTTTLPSNNSRRHSIKIAVGAVNAAADAQAEKEKAQAEKEKEKAALSRAVPVSGKGKLLKLTLCRSLLESTAEGTSTSGSPKVEDESAVGSSAPATTGAEAKAPSSMATLPGTTAGNIDTSSVPSTPSGAVTPTASGTSAPPGKKVKPISKKAKEATITTPTPPIDSTPRRPPIFYSMFPVADPDLANGGWVDDILWDSDVEQDEDTTKSSSKKSPTLVLNMNDRRVAPFVAGAEKYLPPKEPTREAPWIPFVGEIAHTTDAKNLSKYMRAKMRRQAKEAEALEKARRDAMAAGIHIKDWSGRRALSELSSGTPGGSGGDIGGGGDNDDDEDQQETSGDPFSSLALEKQYVRKTAPKQRTLGKSIVVHSLPAQKLQKWLFPMKFTPMQLRRWHKPALSLNSMPARSGTATVFPVDSLTYYQKKCDADRAAQRRLGSHFVEMKRDKDLSACDGNISLFEYSEEHPLLMSNVGMASAMTAYHQIPPHAAADYSPQNKVRMGSLRLLSPGHASPFTGHPLKPKHTALAIENNLFIADAYRHDVPKTDFLVIFRDGSMFLRPINYAFVLGQQLPRIEVPWPLGKLALKWNRQRVELHVHQTLRGLIKIEKAALERNAARREEVTIDQALGRVQFRLTNLTAGLPERMNQYVRELVGKVGDYDKKRHLYTLKSDYVVPSDEDLRKLQSPEEACAIESMLVGEQRLSDLGFATVHGEDDEAAGEDSKQDIELKTAPWHLTRNFLEWQRGNCQLAIGGPGDPTRRGLGYSFVRVNNKYGGDKQADGVITMAGQVTGTDADLRRVNLKQAHQLLVQLGVPEYEIIPLARWDRIAKIREISSSAARKGVGGQIYARHDKQATGALRSKTLDKAAKVFETIRRDLSDRVPPPCSSDEEDNADGDAVGPDDADMDALVAEMEGDLGVDLTPEQKAAEAAEAKAREREERARASRRLTITRTHVSNGRRYRREEVIQDPAVIDAYLGIKRRQQAQRSADAAAAAASGQVLKCPLCGGVGHTAASCPRRSNIVEMGESEDDASEQRSFGGDNSNESPIETADIVMDGMRVKFGANLVKAASGSKPQRPPKKSKPSTATSGSKVKSKKKVDTSLDGRSQSVNRVRTSPEVELQNILLMACKAANEIKNNQDFRKSVSAKLVPDYYTIIKKPMDLTTLRENTRNNVYSTSATFLKDADLLRSNCVLYNGLNHPLVAVAEKVVSAAKNVINIYAERLKVLEEAIDPLAAADVAEIASRDNVEHEVIDHTAPQQVKPAFITQSLPARKVPLNDELDMAQVNGEATTHKRPYS